MPSICLGSSTTAPPSHCPRLSIWSLGISLQRRSAAYAPARGQLGITHQSTPSPQPPFISPSDPTAPTHLATAAQPLCALYSRPHHSPVASPLDPCLCLKTLFSRPSSPSNLKALPRAIVTCQLSSPLCKHCRRSQPIRSPSPMFPTLPFPTPSPSTHPPLLQ